MTEDKVKTQQDFEEELKKLEAVRGPRFSQHVDAPVRILFKNLTQYLLWSLGKKLAPPSSWLAAQDPGKFQYGDVWARAGLLERRHHERRKTDV